MREHAACGAAHRRATRRGTTGRRPGGAGGEWPWRESPLFFFERGKQGLCSMTEQNRGGLFGSTSLAPEQNTGGAGFDDQTKGSSSGAGQGDEDTQIWGGRPIAAGSHSEPAQLGQI
jgi:hypothetical protein